MMKPGRAGGMQSGMVGVANVEEVVGRDEALRDFVARSLVLICLLTLLGFWIGISPAMAIGVTDTENSESEIGPIDVAPPAGLSLASHSLPPVASAPPPSDTSMMWGSETATADDFDYAALPGRLSDDGLRSLWRQGLAHERSERLLESSEYYERIVAQVPEESFTYWRLSRNYWRAGESLPTDAVEERLSYFKRAERWAARGIAVDDECAPCMLWQFVSMGRQATTEGIWTAARYAKDMSQLLERGIALKPQHRDEPANSVLGNLYYSGAVFYRFVPDSWWLKVLIGVRGDLDRSLSFIRQAVEISDQRVDYRVELGAVLLCRGEKKRKPESTSEGLAVLREARMLPAYLSTDHLDLEHATSLIEEPKLACGYSRDGFIDMDEVVERAKVTSREAS